MPFDTTWDRFSGVMDDKVDELLGDLVDYRIGGAGPEHLVRAFVLTEADGEASANGFDEAFGSRKRVKIRAATIGGIQRRSDRIRHPKLGPGVFQPGPALALSDGRYLIFDVQEV